jgi:hypothetical protein
VGCVKDCQCGEKSVSASEINRGGVMMAKFIQIQVDYPHIYYY